jgi:hypothetical protein
MPMDTYTVRNWEPAGRTITLMNFSGLAILIAGLIVYGGLWSAATGASEATFTAGDLLIAVIATFGLMVAHEGVHGVAIAAFGGKPVYGATMIGKALPAFYCTSPGTLFTRAQFVAIALAPAVVLGIGTAIAIATLPASGWLVVPAAIHLGGCVGDFAMTIIAARLPAGSRVEDMKSGMRLYLPAEDASPESV